MFLSPKGELIENGKFLRFGWILVGINIMYFLNFRGLSVGIFYNGSLSMEISPGNKINYKVLLYSISKCIVSHAES